MKALKLAILDLYDNAPNQGMRCIKEIVRLFESEYDWDVFDVRAKAEVPDLSYDIFISTGGPGSPHDGDGVWDRKYFEWLENLWQWNKKDDRPKKMAIFICHSFQMACRHFKVATVNRRKSMSFGTFPVHQTSQGATEPLFAGLSNPFYVADFRDYQVVKPDLSRLQELGADILCLEKIRPHVALERAIMGIRFSDEMIGVQFHPEADPQGMLIHFDEPARKRHIIETYGEEKLIEMIKHLLDEKKIQQTRDTVLPMFLAHALKKLHSTAAVH